MKRRKDSRSPAEAAAYRRELDGFFLRMQFNVVPRHPHAGVLIPHTELPTDGRRVGITKFADQQNNAWDDVLKMLEN